MDANEAIRLRRSVRSYTDQPVDEKDISEIADAAEVDENTLSSLVTLKHRDIVDLLKRS